MRIFFALVAGLGFVSTAGHAQQFELQDVASADATSVVQLKPKSILFFDRGSGDPAEGGDLFRWGEAFRRAAERHRTLFFVNDRADVAAAVGADGVHVGQNDLPVEVTRRLVGRDMLIGLSTHDEAQLRAASPQADYVCVGPIHQTPTKPGRDRSGMPVLHVLAIP